MLRACFSKFDGFSIPKNNIWKLENQSKSRSKGFKIHTKSSSKPIVVQITSPNLIFFEFLRFLMDFWTSKWTQNLKKSHKNRCRRTTYFGIRFLIEFSWIWTPKMEPKSMDFRTFLENVDFAKIVLPSRRNCYFKVSGLTKTMRNVSKLVFEKRMQKSDPPK